jgi:hypothetical protein
VEQEMNYAKYIWTKMLNSEALSDQEVLDGITAFEDLVKDLKETFKWQEAADEAMVTLTTLKAIKKARGIE